MVIVDQNRVYELVITAKKYVGVAKYIYIIIFLFLDTTSMNLAILPNISSN